MKLNYILIFIPPNSKLQEYKSFGSSSKHNQSSNRNLFYALLFILITKKSQINKYYSEDFKPLACRFTTNISSQTLAMISNNIVIRIHV